MVVTPWGSSELLRERMLPPGPGRTSAAVAENQRRRLFGAMVASVAERGYWNTRVADLIELSGVSLRSFYDLFPDKRSCFLATLSSLASTTVEMVLGGLSESSWEEESRHRLATFAKLVAAQPAAARLFLIEAYVAGPEAIAVVDEMSRRVEELVRQQLASSEEWAELSTEIATVAVATVLETFRLRLLKGQTQQLPELADEIASLLLSLKPPLRPLRAAARQPQVRPEEREASDHAERGMRAFEALLAKQPYAETTMEQVAKRAGMSVRTLYANFSGREELMLAAVDSAGALSVATALPAYRRHPNPAEGIRASLSALFGLWASRPHLAHLLLFGAFEGGAPALKRRTEALQPLQDLLTEAAPMRLAAPPRRVAEMIWGGVLGLAYRRMAAAGTGTLAGLAPICTYIALAPVLGVEDATAAAQGKSYRRVPSNLFEAGRLAHVNPQVDRLMTLIAQGPISLADLVEAVPYSREEVERSVSELEGKGYIVVDEGARRAEPVYRTRWPLLATADWARLGLGERELTSAEIGWAIKEEVEDAFASGSFDARPERFLVRLPMWLDDEGWKELSETLDGTVDACHAIQRRVQTRLRAHDARGGSPARVLLVSFETPHSEPD